MRDLTSMLVVVALSTCFVSCSDDDDDDATSTTVAGAVAGTYSVYASVDFTYISTPYYYNNQTVTITEASETTVNVSYSNDTWGDYAVSGATVTKSSDGSYTLAGTGTATIAYHGNSATEYDCTFAGTIASDKTITELTFTMSFMGTTTLTLYDGDCPSAYLISGSKSGYTEVVFAYASMFYTDEDLTITSVSETTVDISYSNDTWGEYVAEDVTVTSAGDGTYTISGEGTATIAYHTSTASEYSFTVTGTADSDGTITEIAFYLEFMGGTTISFFEADAPAAYLLDGDYTGTLSAVFAYGSLSYEDESLTISASVGSETVDITYSNDTWGDYSFTGVEIGTDEDGNYTLSATGTATIAYHSSDATDYECTLTATISSDKSTYTFTMYMEFMGGTTLTLENTSEE